MMIDQLSNMVREYCRYVCVRLRGAASGKHKLVKRWKYWSKSVTNNEIRFWGSLLIYDSTSVSPYWLSKLDLNESSMKVHALPNVCVWGLSTGWETIHLAQYNWKSMDSNEWVPKVRWQSRSLVYSRYKMCVWNELANTQGMEKVGKQERRQDQTTWRVPFDANGQWNALQVCPIHTHTHIYPKSEWMKWMNGWWPS